MHTRPRASAFATLVVAVALAGSTTAAAHAAEPTATTPSAVTVPDITDPAEAARVDSVVADIDWFDCSNVVDKGVQCGTVDLPLDYDDPEGPTTSVALVRVPATKPTAKLGSLFLNPGGPGGSGVNIAINAPYFLPKDIVQRFDLIGVDPRGTNFSDNVACFRNIGEQTDTLLPTWETAYPRTTAQRTDFVNSAKKYGQACTTLGQPLSASMSTANVARDMDVLRRTLGDEKLSYLGFSYGTYLGNVYANLFPDRVRAIVLDGVLDPEGWAGTEANKAVPQTQRIASGDGALKALRSILTKCGQKGPDYCYLAKRSSNPSKKFDKFAKELKQNPIVFDDDFEIDYGLVMSFLLSDLYQFEAGAWVDMDLDMFMELQETPTNATERKQWNAAAKKFKARLKEYKQFAADQDAQKQQLAAKVPGFAFPYDNSPEAYQSVMCSDSLNPGNAASWVAAGNTAAKTGDAFGQMWTWASAPCASWTWKAVDEDAYRGTFDHVTSAPVLVVGNWWDPATNYNGAKAAAKLLPNSSFVSSNSWGHTAFGSSTCVDNAITNYLLTGKATKGATRSCVGQQPFTQKLDSSGYESLSITPQKGRAPITIPVPGEVPSL
ncbi:alpha/beta hydrolase [Cellulomonas palmilytica]|uniref:alpha/beta hydrolase n=1 Tax=Cellulomonas palmilytica TaxID=2608402 RepID=UPI001F26C52E|nr:alpha/beta hydrolase [Cellulomonas palmilytica]UJP40718.1 alpha/beta fold hydrolase [Cellulomonas palmilytica]